MSSAAQKLIGAVASACLISSGISQVRHEVETSNLFTSPLKLGRSLYFFSLFLPAHQHLPLFSVGIYFR